MKCMLTTFDNEINPYDDYIAWQIRDKDLGHNTSEHLAEITEFFSNVSDSEMTDAERELVNENAIDFIIIHDPLNIYKKVREP